MRDVSDKPVDLEWPDDARRDRLIGDWHIYQRTGGHRTSTDDLITAWYACSRTPDNSRVEQYLDLGCGIASVMLMTCHRLRPKVAVGVEAQAQSVMMAKRALEELPPHPIEMTLHHGDFRQLKLNVRHFDLITGSPPYFPLDAGVLPSDAQRRDCRFESRGGVEAYVAAAATYLAEHGRFYVVHQTRWGQRVLDAAKAHGFHLCGQADFKAKADHNESFLSVYELTRHPAGEVHRVSMAVRTEDGGLTSEYQVIRKSLGLDANT